MSCVRAFRLSPGRGTCDTCGVLVVVEEGISVQGAETLRVRRNNNKPNRLHGEIQPVAVKLEKDEGALGHLFG